MNDAQWRTSSNIARMSFMCIFWISISDNPLKVYAEDAPRNASDNQKWKPFSEQEKMVVRKGFSAAEGVIDFMKPNPTFKLTKVQVSEKLCLMNYIHCELWILIQKGSKRFKMVLEKSKKVLERFKKVFKSSSV